MAVPTCDSVVFLPQVQRVKQERLSHSLAPLELQDFQDPLGSQGHKVLLKSSLPGYHRVPLGISHTDCLPSSPQVTEASQEPQDGQASQERRVLWASRGLDFPGFLVPKVSPVWDCDSGQKTKWGRESCP